MTDLGKKISKDVDAGSIKKDTKQNPIMLIIKVLG